MSMNVTYKAYKGKKLIVSAVNNVCFSKLFSTTIHYNRVDVRIKNSELTNNLVDFWLALVKQIEPSFKTYKTNGELWGTIKSKNRYKILISLTILRYLWEDENNYDDIVIMTNKIIDRFPDIDPLSAVIMANSGTSNCSGWGHSLVQSFTDTVHKTWHYRRTKTETVHGFTKEETTSYVEMSRKLQNIRKMKKDPFDIEPILTYYKVAENFKKYKKSYG